MLDKNDGNSAYDEFKKIILPLAKYFIQLNETKS